jgi:hypothetical protein
MASWHAEIPVGGDILEKNSSVRGSLNGQFWNADAHLAKQAPNVSHINGTERFAKEGPYTYTLPMKTTLIGYARCSTDKQDLSAQRYSQLSRLSRWHIESDAINRGFVSIKVPNPPQTFLH